jgi:CDGSH-type Zn-finger protein/uncharacterized Fe-S cluster protein YjdI
MKPKSYERDDLTVEYLPPRCIHAAECVRGLPAVFDPERRPWIDASQAEADAIADVIRRCPTGALRWRRKDGGPEETPDEHATMSVAPDGPVWVRGPIRLKLPSGETVEDTRVALCRCGQSKHKPYCDNSHVGAGFRDPGALGEGRMKEADGTEDAAVELSAAPNGPIFLKGPVTVTGADGRSVSGVTGALCRCGASNKKPFCDGMHKQIGFEAD